jgi:hypothetical protein
MRFIKILISLYQSLDIHIITNNIKNIIFQYYCYIKNSQGKSKMITLLTKSNNRLF